MFWKSYSVEQFHLPNSPANGGKTPESPSYGSESVAYVRNKDSTRETIRVSERMRDRHGMGAYLARTALPSGLASRIARCHLTALNYSNSFFKCTQFPPLFRIKLSENQESGPLFPGSPSAALSP